MKNIFKILFAIILLISIKLNGQLPLQFGDGIITHSPANMTSGPSGIVVRVIKASNTSTAPTGGNNWNTSTMLPTGSKPSNWFTNPNWNVSTLGRIFGITLDENLTPNIYVSSSQLYINSTINNRKIWRLDGTSGVNTLVYDFNNPSGIGSNTSLKSLGNVKYGKFGATENIYVTDWQTGEINRLVGNSASTLLWTNQPSFNPKFGKAIDDVTELPYGLAIRNTPTGKFLYYSKISTVPISYYFGLNEIWSVQLDAVGNFVAGSETNTNFSTSLNSLLNGNPISDIAFTTDGKRMLVAQQTWQAFASLNAHASQVREFRDNTFSGIFSDPGNLFPSGTWASSTNSAGGVSYSNNIAWGNGSSFACDTTVWFSSDAIHYPAPYVYGVQGYHSGGGIVTNSIWLDADDDITNGDKTQLGDVEIYKKPNVCTVAIPCQCGSWDSISFNNQGPWWLPPTAASGSPIPTLSFNQGAVSGVLIPHYHCLGTNCNATFTYSVASHGKVTTLTGSSSGGLDLNQPALSSLTCGHYSLCITPHCGSTDCPSQCIPFEIICLPLCACKSNVTVNGNPQSLTVVTQNNTATANPVSVVSGSFTLTSSTPVTEVRMLVDEFRVITKTGNENCRLCKNKPQTWGSINSASLSGVALQTFITPTLTNDIREFVFNNGSNTVFNLSGNTLNFSIALPGVTGLDCCNLQIEMCLKFIVRDNNCCETEILKCGTFDLAPKANTGSSPCGTCPPGTICTAGKCQ